MIEVLESKLIYGNLFYPYTNETVRFKKWLVNRNNIDDIEHLTREEEAEIVNLFEQAELQEIEVSDLVCCQAHLVPSVLTDEKHIFLTSILGYRPYNSSKVIIHEGHHRIARALVNGEKTIKIKVYNQVPQEFFKELQNI